MVLLFLFLVPPTISPFTAPGQNDNSTLKALSKTDLQASQNATIQWAFNLPHVSNEDIAHIFDLRLCQMQNLRLKWRCTGDLTPGPWPGHPMSDVTICAQCTFCRKVTQDPVQTVAQLSHGTGVSQTTGRQIIAGLGLHSR